MKKILLVSHGLMAMGLYEAARMIIGDEADIDYIGLSADKHIEDFKQELERKSEWILDCDELYVLADVLGGSPYTTTINYLQNKNMLLKSKVISGMNLPLLVGLVFGNNLLDKNNLMEVIENAKGGINLFEINNEEDNDEDL